MLGELISAGANLIGGFMNKGSADAAREASERAAANNIAMQREFAQSGIQWRVEDAKKAGIHPIYALGSGGASFSPVSQNFTADTSLGNAMASAGQDIGRAINQTRTQGQRVDAFTATAQKLSLEKAGLENDLLRTEIASKTGRLRSPGSSPFPAPGDNWLVPGQAQSGLVKPKPLEVAPGVPSAPQSEGGAITDVGLARTVSGWAPVPSKDVKERIEDNLPQEIMHFYRNNILPSLGINMSPPPFKAPDGKQWWFNTLRQEYQLLPKGERPSAGHPYRGN